jgi:hypothetical protein
MRKLVAWLVAVAVAAFLSAAGAARAEEPFDFYGLRFGMSGKDAAAAMPYIPGENGLANVKDPGRGMVALTLLFDREGLLMEIHASYPRPEDALELEGVRRALRERFVTPVQAGFKEVTVSLDEYNRAALTLVFVSRTRREKNIEYYKGEFLKKM